MAEKKKNYSTNFPLLRLNNGVKKSMPTLRVFPLKKNWSGVPMKDLM